MNSLALFCVEMLEHRYKISGIEQSRDLSTKATNADLISTNDCVENFNGISKTLSIREKYHRISEVTRAIADSTSKLGHKIMKLFLIIWRLFLKIWSLILTAKI